MNQVHQSKYFAIYQCDLKRCFCFKSAHKSVYLTLCQLLVLRSKVNSMNLESHFDELRNPSGIEILLFCDLQHVIILDTYQLIDLKELISNTFDKLLCPALLAPAV